MSRVKERLKQYKLDLEKQTQYKQGLPGSALDIVNTLLADLEEDEKKNGWIPAKEKPSEYGRYLVTFKQSKEVYIAEYGICQMPGRYWDSLWDVDGTVQLGIIMRKTVLWRGNHFQNTHIRRIRNMRLIDADLVLKRLEEWNTSDKMDKALYNFARNRIVEQPTAYNIDKVVEQLEEIKRMMESNISPDCFREECIEADCTICLAGKVIEIVKGGGTE